MTTVKHKTTGKISNVDSTYANRVKQQVTVYLKDCDERRLAIPLQELMRDYEVVPEESKVKIPGQFRTKTGCVYCPFFSKLTGPYVDTIDAGCCEALASVGLSFETKAECSKWLKKQEAEQVLRRDTKGFKATRDADRFYYVSYDIYDHSFDISSWDVDCCGGELTSPLVFATEADAEASVKFHPNEWKAYLGVEE